MGIKADTQIEMRDILGLVSNRDPHDLRPGQAEEQVNIMILRPGEMMIRRGLKELVFDTDDT
jgi:hypothetical protein